MLILFVSLLLLSTLWKSDATTNLTSIELNESSTYRVKRQDLQGFQFVDCVLPRYPENGKWEVIGGYGSPGSTILPNTLIRIWCNSGYILVPSTEYFVCDNEWNPGKMSHCEETFCPALKSTPSTTFKCFDQKGLSVSCSQASQGSIASVKCTEYYERPAGAKSNLQCIDKQWSDPIPRCEPICGKPVSDDRLRLKRNTGVSTTKFPWIVTLYRKEKTRNRYLCSGSLVSIVHVLTAAHCVSNDFGEMTSAKDYQIAAGKSSHIYGDPMELMSQYVDVGQIIIHPEYKGHIGNYRSDIAVLKAKRQFRLSLSVQPICIKGLKEITVPEGTTGSIALWGLQTDGTITKDVKYFEVTKNDTKCEQGLPKDFALRYISAEKLCALIEKGSETVCTGYSGAGWVFRNPTDNRYYIHGIVDLAPYNTETHCVEASSLCTKVSYYYDFIQTQLELS